MTTQDTPAETPLEDTQSQASDPQAELDLLRERLDKAEGDVLRALADRENTIKRMEREKSEAIKFAVSGFVKDLLTVADIFDQALAHVPESEAGSAVETFVTGITMTAKQLLCTLEKHGVSKYNPVGEAFDHNLHQAMLQESSDTIPQGHIVRVIQAGYRMHDRVVRPALVTVSA
ncbi:MAG: nucleotide exchange factor GrpE [Alphaproteobacteria bacterium]